MTHRIVINPDTPNAWEAPLKEGMNFLGSGSENDVPIQHDSVSAAHCEIMVNGSSVTLRDLESQRGTFLNGQRIGEAHLQPGQIVALGDVLLRLEPPRIPGSPAAPAENSRASRFCRYHRHSFARYACPKCGHSFCDLCVGIRRERGESRGFCRACSVECTPQEIIIEPESEEPVSFPRMIAGAFKYPFTGDGPVLLILGGFILLMLNAAKYLAKFAFLYGIGALFILTVFGTGFLVSFLREILTSSAAGEDKPPNWPDATDLGGEIVVPFLQFAGTVLACFAPALFLTALAPENSPWLSWVLTALILIGCIYFPMAFMAVAMFDSIGAVNPLLIVPSIMKIARAYFLTIAILGTVLVVQWLGDTVLPAVLEVGFLGRLAFWVVSNFIGLYLLIVEVRILGLLYRVKKDELGWFN